MGFFTGSEAAAGNWLVQPARHHKLDAPARGTSPFQGCPRWRVGLVVPPLAGPANYPRLPEQETRPCQGRFRSDVASGGVHPGCRRDRAAAGNGLVRSLRAGTATRCSTRRERWAYPATAWCRPAVHGGSGLCLQAEVSRACPAPGALSARRAGPRCALEDDHHQT